MCLLLYYVITRAGVATSPYGTLPAAPQLSAADPPEHKASQGADWESLYILAIELTSMLLH